MLLGRFASVIEGFECLIALVGQLVLRFGLLLGRSVGVTLLELQYIGVGCDCG